MSYVLKTQTTSQSIRYGSQTGIYDGTVSARSILKQGRSVPVPAASPGTATEVLNPITAQSVRGSAPTAFDIANDRGHYIRQKIGRDLSQQVAKEQLLKGVTRRAAQKLIPLVGPALLLNDLYDLYQYAQSTEWIKKRPSGSFIYPPVPTGDSPPTVPGGWIPVYEWSNAIGAVGGSSWSYRDVGYRAGAGTSSVVPFDPFGAVGSHILSANQYNVDNSTSYISAVGAHGPADQWGVNGTWFRPSNAPLPEGGLQVGGNPRQTTDTDPNDSPSLRPEQQPGHRNNPDRRQNMDNPNPRENTHGPAPRGKPDGAPRPKDGPAGSPRPIAPPLEIVSPGGMPRTLPKPDEHRSKPPGPGDKERKVFANVKNGSLTGFLVGTVTESIDFIEAVHKAIPKELRRHWRKDAKGKWRPVKPAVDVMLADIYKQFDKINLNEALKNVLLEQLQDAAVGKLGKRAQQEAKPFLEKLGRPVGFGTGPAL